LVVLAGFRRLQEQEQWLVWDKRKGWGCRKESFEELQDAAAAAAILNGAACGLQAPAQTQHTVKTSYAR
jgi:hypothetical protein